MNCARPCASVFRGRRASCPIFSVTGWSDDVVADALAHQTRTVTVPSAAPAPAAARRPSATGRAWLLRAPRSACDAMRTVSSDQRRMTGPACQADRCSLLPQFLQNRASGSLAVPQAQRQGVAVIRSVIARGNDGLRPVLGAAIARRPADGRPSIATSRVAQLLLDLVAIAAARVELLHQPERAAAQPRAHLLEIGLRDLLHRVVELELLDRPQDQRLLPLERGARSAADACVGVCRLLRRHERRQAIR